ncbi:efflux RND transporter periplasmic adaptor subunit (plasmid) [Caballeronia sp. NK8]|uniref:efflux RND transporter periplasmic adaptor subunit n=1 Tax=Caballeronia sp. NK8 TaxID=140098 RepID=UPI001BB493D1|nr:HlyD family secretion protein [Caballeronia sp. NK8]BCQ27361.1 efflux RND transporter periplasmic adaptor subunit [Caballeronia sp. NK8]
MKVKRIWSVFATMTLFLMAAFIGKTLWDHYMYAPWTRDGRIHADVVTIAPDVSGMIVGVPVHDNEFVRKGDLLMQIDPSHYRIAVDEAEAKVAASRAELALRRDDAKRRAALENEVVSEEVKQNSGFQADAAKAAYDQALAALDAARLNLARTRVVSPVDGYVTNLNTWQGDYATIATPKLAVVDRNSFWVYGYFEETKLPEVKVGREVDIRLMSGTLLRGHVESIARGIYDRDNPQSMDLTANVDPVFNWVRLAQRVPVRIGIDSVPQGVELTAGTTCTVVVDGGGAPGHLMPRAL